VLAGNFGRLGVNGCSKTLPDKRTTLFPLDAQLETSAWRSGQRSALCHWRLMQRSNIFLRHSTIAVSVKYSPLVPTSRAGPCSWL